MQLPARIELEEGLALRVPRIEDAPALFSWASDPEVTRYLGFKPHADLEESRAVLRGWEKAWAELGGRLTPCRALAYLIEWKGEPVGSLSVLPLRFGDELGYALAKKAWGQGVASAAVRGFSDWLLEHGRPRITATAHVENAASHRVLEKAGFLREGRLRSYFFFPNLGERADGYLFARVK